MRYLTTADPNVNIKRRSLFTYDLGLWRIWYVNASRSFHGLEGVKWYCL